MKMLIILALVITTSIALASDKDNRCIEDSQPTTNEPIIREIR